MDPSESGNTRSDSNRFRHEERSNVMIDGRMTAVSHTVSRDSQPLLPTPVTNGPPPTFMGSPSQDNSMEGQRIGNGHNLPLAPLVDNVSPPIVTRQLGQGGNNNNNNNSNNNNQQQHQQHQHQYQQQHYQHQQYQQHQHQHHPQYHQQQYFGQRGSDGGRGERFVDDITHNPLSNSYPPVPNNKQRYPTGDGGAIHGSTTGLQSSSSSSSSTSSSSNGNGDHATGFNNHSGEGVSGSCGPTPAMHFSSTQDPTQGAISNANPMSNSSDNLIPSVDNPLPSLGPVHSYHPLSAQNLSQMPYPYISYPNQPVPSTVTTNPNHSNTTTNMSTTITTITNSSGDSRNNPMYESNPQISTNHQMQGQRNHQMSMYQQHYQYHPQHQHHQHQQYPQYLQHQHSHYHNDQHQQHQQQQQHQQHQQQHHQQQYQQQHYQQGDGNYHIQQNTPQYDPQYPPQYPLQYPQTHQQTQYTPHARDALPPTGHPSPDAQGMYLLNQLQSQLVYQHQYQQATLQQRNALYRWHQPPLKLTTIHDRCPKVDDYFTPPPTRYTTYLIQQHIFQIESRYRIKSVVGYGAYGVVVSARDLYTGRVVAIKKLAEVFHHRGICRRTLRELKMLRLLRHPNILSCERVMLPPRRNFDDVHVVMEMMETDLGAVIRSPQPLSNAHCQFFILQLLLGLRAIHSAGVIHRDLKPKNLLVRANCDLKICDFGLARVDDEANNELFHMSSYVATRWYRAPEIILYNQPYSKAVDMWSVGCILAELLGRVPIFAGKDTMHQLCLILSTLGTPPLATLNKMKAKSEARGPDPSFKPFSLPRSHSKGNQKAVHEDDVENKAENEIEDALSPAPNSPAVAMTISPRWLKEGGNDKANQTNNNTTNSTPTTLHMDIVTSPVDDSMMDGVESETKTSHNHDKPNANITPVEENGRNNPSCQEQMDLATTNSGGRVEERKGDGEEERLISVEEVGSECCDLDEDMGSTGSMTTGTAMEGAGAEWIARDDAAQAREMMIKGRDGKTYININLLYQVGKIPPMDLASLYPRADPRAIDLLRRLLAFDPDERITVEEALTHPFVADITVPSSLKYDSISADDMRRQFAYESNDLTKDDYRGLIAEEVFSHYAPEAFSPPPQHEAMIKHAQSVLGRIPSSSKRRRRGSA